METPVKKVVDTTRAGTSEPEKEVEVESEDEEMESSENEHQEPYGISEDQGTIKAQIAQAFQQIVPYIILQIKETINDTVEEVVDRKLQNFVDSISVQQKEQLMSGKEGKEKFEIKNFMICKPPIFDGELDPMISMRWLDGIENTFVLCDCPEPCKVKYAAHMLQKRGKDWWELVVKSKGLVGAVSISWEEFRTMFLEMFAPEAEVAKIREEFLTIDQGNMSVAEYWGIFIDKSKFCPEYVKNEKLLCEHFHLHLRSEIREFVDPMIYKTLEKMINRALSTEKDRAKILEAARKKKAEQTYTSREPAKHHRRGMMECFRCGQVSHFSRDCPSPLQLCQHCFSKDHASERCPKQKGVQKQHDTRKNQEKKFEAAPRPKGRSFQITADEARQATDVMTETSPPNINGSSQLPESSQEVGKTVMNVETCKTMNVEPGHGTNSQLVLFSKASSPADVAQAGTLVQQTHEKVKRGREEGQANTKREKALRRKIANKEAKLSSQHLNSVKTKQADVAPSALKGCLELDPASVPPEFLQVTENVKNVDEAALISQKLHEWSSESVKDSKYHEMDVPDPDFHNFDRDRSKRCFEEGQVWAAYDDPDGMPRSYAMIHKVISLDPFKMKVCWLDSKPGKKEAFGEFKAGKHEIVSATNYFSHKANFTKHESGNVRVFPKIGDVCALYKNDQTSGLVRDKYEIVEVDRYDEETGITVTPLVKVNGFKTVFRSHLDPKETRVFSKKEMSRFSYQIPSCLLTGQESPSALKGYLELDPASVPPEFLQVTENVKNVDEAALISQKLHEWSSEIVKDLKDHEMDVPDPDFHNFDRDRSKRCFEEGQVWAAYDDPDGMPRSYAMIRKVISVDPFKIKVCWLDSKPGKKEAFGEFKAGKHEIVSALNYFSHKANFTKQESGNIRVFPKIGDVCALYRNDQTSGLVKDKYEIVEVDQYDEETGITVTPLVKVAGFKTVFRRHLDPKETRVFLKKEMSGFSYQIPSYFLTGQESPSAPKGCLELDPASVPPEFLQVTENVKNVNEAANIMAEDRQT